MFKFKYKSNLAVLLLHVLPFFDTLTTLLCQETSDVIPTEITATTNFPVTIQCFVDNPQLTLWLLQTKWCGYSSALTLGGYNLKNETYFLHIGNETGRTTYSLTVNQPSKEMDGTYICQERGINKVFATLHVNTDDSTDKTLTVVVNSTAEMHCMVKDYQFAHWLFAPSGTTGTPVTLSSAGSVFNTHDYSLIIQHKEDFTTYNLIIYNTTEDMQGNYSCREQGVSKADITLTVEGQPEVWIEKDGSKLGGMINVTLDKNYDLTCIASSVTSQGWLSWERNSRNLSDEVTYQNSENEISSILSYKPLIGDTRLTCIFSGQIAVPSIKVTLEVNVFYPPYCNLSTSINNLNQLIVHCSCVGNPEISTVYILVNASLHTTAIVSISSKYPAYLNCFAENHLGQLSNKPTHKYKPLPVPVKMKESQFPIRWVITTLSFILLLLCLLLGIIIFRKKRHVSSSYFTWEPTVSQTTFTMSERPVCRSPPETTEHRFLATASKYYETVPATNITTELDQVSTDEQVEYNAQYFELPLDHSEEKAYAEADNKGEVNVCEDTLAESRASIGSSFSDADYFGPLSEGGTMDKKVRLLDAKYKFKGQQSYQTD